MKFLKALLFTYPQRILLLILNSGIFIWLQMTSQALLRTSGLDVIYENYAPEYLKAWTQGNFERFIGFLETSSWAWLVASLLLLLIWPFLFKIVRTLLFLLCLGIAGWLIWTTQDLLSQFT